MDCKLFCKKVALGLAAAALICPVLSAHAGASTEPIGPVTYVTSSDAGNGSLSDESSLGSAIADAAAHGAGTEIAIINGGDILEGAKLAAGQAGREQITAVFAQDRPLARCSVTPAQLSELLNLCLAAMTFDPEDLSVDYEGSASPAFPQISGFTLTYDVSAPVGERVMAVKLWNGDELELEDDATQISLACPAFLLDGGYGEVGFVVDYTLLDLTESQALECFVADGRMADYTPLDRITIVGSTEDSLFDQVASTGLLLVVCAVVLFAAASKIVTNIKNRDYIYDPNDRAL